MQKLSASLLFALFLNLFIYELSLAASWIDIPLKTWVSRPLPATGEGACPGGTFGGCKHMRLAHNPVNGRIYFEGGDYSGGDDNPQSGRNELYSYSLAQEEWKLEYPYCGPTGEVQPSHPDEVGWIYDTKRNIFWMLPGFMYGSGGCPAESATQVAGSIMTFDPTTGKWDVPNRDSGATGEAYAFAVYDPLTDTIIRFYGDSSGVDIRIYDIDADTWTVTSQSQDANGVMLNGFGLGKEYAAVDYEKRHIYLTNMYTGQLLRYDMDTQQVLYLIDTPTKLAPENFGMQSSPPLIWDSVSNVLLWPFHETHSDAITVMYVYHPDTNTWEQPSMYQPDGFTVQGNSAVFDPQQNAMLLIGGSKGGYSNFFLYRYGNGSDAPPDTTPPSAPMNLQIR